MLQRQSVVVTTSRHTCSLETQPRRISLGVTRQSGLVQEVEEYVEKIKAAGGHATVYVYPGEGHAFMNSDPDSFKRMDSEPPLHCALFADAYLFRVNWQELHQRSKGMT